MIITAIKYIFNNLWDKIDVCLVFKGNQDCRMIDLSTQTIFLWWYSQCSVKMDSSTAVSEMWRAIFTAWQIWLPSNATLIQIYLLLFIQVKKRVTVGRCCTSSTKRAALHCTHSILCVCGYQKTAHLLYVGFYQKIECRSLNYYGDLHGFFWRDSAIPMIL